MASKVTLDFTKSEKRYPVFTYGSTFTALSLSPHVAFTLDFQTGIPDVVVNIVLKAIREQVIDHKDRPYFNKVHLGTSPVKCTLEEAAELAAKETTVRVLQDKRESTTDKILIVRSEDYFVQRYKKINKESVEHPVTNLRGIYITIPDECVSFNPWEPLQRFSHFHEKNILTCKTVLTLSTNEHMSWGHKATLIARQVCASMKSTISSWHKV
ncbi:hypothetical protein AbHV_ORF37 [Abalone herpesvirus Victoria/AUS/2009]|uniref:Uncharacterized protein n=2 Tax=Aurivirus haliotidmalaco1 TaxID=3050290 RepID=K4K8H3_ABHV|nr:hypothetical protein AbHV_ORF37 [Abalone herpesvirus Victoria/AUS/2009]ADL16657.1 AbHVp018c [Abalone herpesvirus Victoria/AUS/2007]AET13867.1 tc_p028c [Abalone herpesvirus Taiwan/2004]AFU90047.1 hypothetical protein AbHV_ORF37 [Abalone herpesvirus Victoria/AUS/2009]UCX57023.1 hypothetical protein [Haliotid herpesvirus 1]